MLTHVILASGARETHLRPTRIYVASARCGTGTGRHRTAEFPITRPRFSGPKQLPETSPRRPQNPQNSKVTPSGSGIKPGSSGGIICRPKQYICRPNLSICRPDPYISDSGVMLGSSGDVICRPKPYICRPIPYICRPKPLLGSTWGSRVPITRPLGGHLEHLDDTWRCIWGALLKDLALPAAPRTPRAHKSMDFSMTAMVMTM